MKLKIEYVPKEDLKPYANNAKIHTAEQIEQIKEGVIDGSAPDGFVWHHNEEEGVIQLVDRVTHERTGHMGGRAIWGGGY